MTNTLDAHRFIDLNNRESIAKLVHGLTDGHTLNGRNGASVASVKISICNFFANRGLYLINVPYFHELLLNAISYVKRDHRLATLTSDSRFAGNVIRHQAERRCQRRVGARDAQLAPHVTQLVGIPLRALLRRPPPSFSISTWIRRASAALLSSKAFHLAC